LEHGDVSHISDDGVAGQWFLEGRGNMTNTVSTWSTSVWEWIQGVRDIAFFFFAWAVLPNEKESDLRETLGICLG